MQWLDVYVQVPAWRSEDVSVYLQHLGSAGVVIHDATTLSPDNEKGYTTGPLSRGWTVLYGALPVDEDLPARVCALQQFLDASSEPAAPPLWFLHCRLLQDVDYQTQWRDFFHPFCIGQRLVIHPPWDESLNAAGKEHLALDPGLAFGTGLHPTTHMCLRIMAQRIAPHQGGRLLDIGCGSGILSLAALKLGLDRAVGVDIDAQAVDVAVHNATLNGLRDRVQFLTGSFEVAEGRFAVIVANVYLEPLVQMMPALAKRLEPGGSVILSGILAQQEMALQAALERVGLDVSHREAEEAWVALEGRQVRALPERIAGV